MIKQLLALLLLSLSAFGMTAVTVGSGQSIATVVNGASVGPAAACAPASGWRPAIQAGLCVHVASGNVSGGTINNSGTAAAPIVIIADTKWGPLMNSPLTLNNGGTTTYIYIEGLQVSIPASANAILLGPGNHRWVEYNYIHDMNTTVGCNDPRGGVIHETTAPMNHDTINGNIIHHFGSTCPQNGYHGIYADGAAVQITNNIISGGGSGWGIQKQYASNTDCTPGVISNNTVFNNAGGIVLNDEGSACRINNWTISNNIVILNHVSGTGTGGLYGIDYFHMQNAPQTLVSNNMVYGNLPADFFCNGGSGCPTALIPKTDSGPTVTFSNWVPDTNASPASPYDANNYQPGAASAIRGGGTATCATGGFTPCVTTLDVVLNTYNSPPTIGARQISGGGTPVSHLSPAPTAFASTNLTSTSATQQTTVTNTGTSNFTITSISVTGTNAADFPFAGTGTCNVGTVVTPGSAGCTISNAFHPSVLGAESATLSVASGASNSPQTVAFSGTGTQPDGSLTSLNGGVPRSVTDIDAAGDWGTLTCPEPSPLPSPIDGSWSIKHDAATAGTSCGTTSLAGSPSQDGQSRRFDISWTANGGERASIFFNPSSLDSISRTFVIDLYAYFSDLTHVNQIEIDMNQVMPNGNTQIQGIQCNFAAGFWQYTTAVNPTTSQWVSSTIACLKPSFNTGTTANHIILTSHRDANGIATYDSVNLNGVSTAFTGASGSSSFTLNWTPIGSNVLNFQINGDNSANSMSAYVDKVTVYSSGASLGFGNQAINTTSPALTAVLFNSGTGPMTITSVATAAPFAVSTHNCPLTPSTLAAGQSCQISVTASPTTAVTSNGLLSIASDAASGTQAIPLAVTGQAPGIPGTGIIISGGVLVIPGVAFNPQ